MKLSRLIFMAVLGCLIYTAPALGFSANTPRTIPGLQLPEVESTPHVAPPRKVAPPPRPVDNAHAAPAIPNNVRQTLFRPVTVSNNNDDGAPAGFVAMLAVVVLLAMLMAFYYLNKRD